VKGVFNNLEAVQRSEPEDGCDLRSLVSKDHQWKMAYSELKYHVTDDNGQACGPLPVVLYSLA